MHRSVWQCLVFLSLLLLAAQSPRDAEGQQPGRRGGLLFFPTYGERDNTAAVANPHILGAFLTVYWSQVETKDGVYDWREIDRRLKPWLDGNKQSALRVM